MTNRTSSNRPSSQKNKHPFQVRIPLQSGGASVFLFVFSLLDTLRPEPIQTAGIENPVMVKSSALFLSGRGEPLTRSGITYIVKKYAGLAGHRCHTIQSKSVSPHTIRHSIAMTLIRSGQEIYMIQDFLGHADINTTHTYFEIDMDMKRKVLEKSSPQDRKQKPPRWKKP
ncbi:MAG: tyrosine-type recombinase/integrase [Acidobacteriota bacterium]|nr:tyrosine-type recombinase/integrase [Acidobacteriota bacterium]